MNLEELKQIQIAALEEQAKFDEEINICMGTGCLSQHSDKIRDALTESVKASGKNAFVRRTGCMGLCAAGPLVLVAERGSKYETVYNHVQASDAEAITAALGGEPVKALQCDLRQHFESQVHIVLENSGHIDPEKIEDYIARDGYESLVKAVTEMKPIDVVNEIMKSGLRGRGGGGYPTGLKWSTVSKAVGQPKYVVCNGDEGDPGAFMDRSVLESDPQRVLEGMAIAAYAVGASHGFIYVRAEYPLAVSRITAAIRDARRKGLLGNNICNSDFNFDVEIRLGAGAFVCGEETALIASIEGKRGTPKPPPPKPAVTGNRG
jgi:bidirectional [NiFe] hydrogenase diaphorase subunit